MRLNARMIHKENLIHLVIEDVTSNGHRCLLDQFEKR